MLPTHPGAAGCGAICLVPGDPGRLSPSHDRMVALAEQWGRAGRSVHVLLTGGTGAPFRTVGAQVHVLDESRSPAAFRVLNLYEPAPIDRGDHIRLALDALHREHSLAAIVFDVRGGVGFRTVQAKRASLGFDDVPLVACLDGCSRWDREQASRWPSSLDEMVRDYAERESFESADVQLTPSSEMAEYVRRGGWVVRKSATGGLFEAVTQWQPSFQPGQAADRPLVTVGIAHYNLGNFLPATLESLAAQTYPNLDVVVIDDGSRDAESARVFDAMERRYPHYRFLRQPNAGIGATRNRCLTEARGEFFIPVDADNIARPEMVERFVGGLRRNPGLSAMTCYFLAFPDTDPGPGHTDLFACRPTGGPHAMASIRNVYGDANAIFRTDDFRAIGGYETDRGTSCEDWEAFVKLVHAGKRIGVVPDHLFYYRHRANGFSRVTDAFANHQRVLRQFARTDLLPAREAEVLWAALLGFQQQVEQLTSRQQCLRYRLADRAHAVYSRFPRASRGLGRLVRSAWAGCRRFAVW